MKSLNELSKSLDKYYIKLPALPKGINEFIVSISPWLALIFGILAVLAGISAFGTLSVVSPFAAIAGVHGYAITAIIAAIILLAQGVVELMAFAPLKGGKVKGWNLLYYSLILSVVSSIITLNVSNVISSIIGALIGYYFLYQIKSYYK
jgi:hypothetical protein